MSTGFLHRASIISLILAMSVEASARGQNDNPVPAPATQPSAVLPLLEKCANAQLAALGSRAPSDWTAATFYFGLARLAHVSGNPKYARAALEAADKNQWKVHTERGRHPPRFFADDQAIGQLYLELAASAHDTTPLQPLIAEESALLGQLQHYNGEISDPDHFHEPTTAKLEVIPWWWCDALFMNPPVLCRLSAVTGDRKFIDGMDKAYWQTYELLYDKEENLFYRDNRFIGKRSKDGKKIFWSRGDGWVMAGLTEILACMPADYPSRTRYEQLFKAMAHKLVTLQEPNGLWPMSLLEPGEGSEETSGSAFYVYAFAWGINHHFLERETFEPAAKKGFAALCARLRPDGQLGFVQPVGYRPESGALTLRNTQLYGNGAFILAGIEMMKLDGELASISNRPAAASESHGEMR